MRPSPVSPTQQAAKEIIDRLEADFDVNALTYRGVRVWPWLRNGLIFYYSQARGPLLDEAIQPAAPRSGDVLEADALYDESTQRRLKHLRRPSGVAAFESLSQAEVLFVARGDRRAVSVGGKAFQTEIDPLIYRLGDRASWLKIDLAPPPDESDAPPFFYPPVHADPSPYLRWLTAFDRAYAAIFEEERREIEQWRALRDILPDLDAPHPPLPEDPAEFAEKAALVFYAGRWFDAILARVRPRLLVSVGHNVIAHGAFLACRRAGVRSVDVQHGAAAIRAKNIKWFGWRTVPDEGYEILPDFFWVWGEEADERIRSTTNNPNVHRPIIGGDAWLTVCPELMGATERIRSPDALEVLVTLTQFSVDEPPDALFEAMRLAPTAWRWRLRLHPSDARNADATGWLAARLEEAGIANAEFAESSSAPLPVLLASADRHVSLYSSVVLQAAAFGLGTVFIHEKARDHFSDLRGQPGVAFETGPEAIVAALEGDQTPPRKLISSSRELALKAFDQMLGA